MLRHCLVIYKEDRDDIPEILNILKSYTFKFPYPLKSKTFFFNMVADTD